MENTILAIERNIDFVSLKRIDKLHTIIKMFLLPLDNVVQNSTHHDGETTLDHVIQALNVITHLLLFLKNQERANIKEIKELNELEESINDYLVSNIKKIIVSDLNKKIDCQTKEHLLFYAILFHDIGKINILKNYETKFSKFNHFSKHHIFGSIIFNFYEDSIKQLDEYKKVLQKTYNDNNKQAIAEEIKYLDIIKNFIEEHKGLLSDISLTKKQLNYISKLIFNSHIFSNPFNEFKQGKKIGKKFKRIIQQLKRDDILVSSILLFYADAMSCIMIFKKKNTQLKLLEFITYILNTY
jgi:hypothetical protein